VLDMSLEAQTLQPGESARVWRYSEPLSPKWVCAVKKTVMERRARLQRDSLDLGRFFIASDAGTSRRHSSAEPCPALPLQDDQLLPQHRDLSLEPRLDLNGETKIAGTN
jgi:hypothetical protein